MVTIDPSSCFKSNALSRTDTTSPVVETDGIEAVVLDLPHPELVPDPPSLMLLQTLFPFTTDEKLNGYKAVTDPLKAGFTPAPQAWERQLVQLEIVNAPETPPVCGMGPSGDPDGLFPLGVPA